MKKTTRFEVVLLTAAIICAVFALFSTSCKASSENYDELIFKKAEERIPEVGFDFSYNPYKYGIISFNVLSKTDTDEYADYFIEVDGIEDHIKVYHSDGTVDRHATTNIKDVRSEYLDVINSSKQLVCKYIDQSNILKEKEKLKKEIQETQFKEATNVSLDDEEKFCCAWFDAIDGIVYVSSNVDPDYVCEDVFVHELIHALDYYTHDCSHDASMEATQFSETITDLITESLNPSKNKKGELSCYAPYYAVVAPYLNLLGEDAIRAYFYGYEEVEEKYGYEFEILVQAIENLVYDNFYAPIYYNHIIYKWYAGDQINVLAPYVVGEPVG